MMPATKQRHAALLLAFAMLLAACASPDANSDSRSADADAGVPPSPVSSPATPGVAHKDDAVADGVVDRSCKVDTDCAIKDVGNCCGRFPQCVNRESPTFPEQVKARCASEGRMSVCGFPSISGCTCVQGQCTGIEGTMDSEGLLQ